MKKKLLVLLTFIISLFVFSGRVEAAKELTCICKDSALVSPEHVMVVQNSNGQLFFYKNSRGNATISDPNWYNPINDYGVKWNFETDKYENDILSSCPNYAQPPVWTGKTSEQYYTFYFSDDKTNKKDHMCIQYDRLPDLDVYSSFTSDKLDEYNKIIENTEWSAKCTYYATDNSKKYLYFNEDRYIFINESNLVYSSTTKFTLKELWDVANSAKGCPPHLYEKNAMPAASLTDNFFMNYFLDNSVSGKEYTSINPEVNFDFGNTIEPDIDIKNCTDLFGADLIKKINDLMDIIKIVVPILLIVYGIVDFTKAVFAGKEDDMSKSRKTFFKRIIAAVLVFLVPIFINLILTLANNVWEDISPDACIGQNN